MPCIIRLTGCLPRQIGNEFSSVEALWSQFENVMGREDDTAQDQAARDHEQDSSTKDHGEQS